MGNELNAAISAALPLIESLFALGLPGVILLLAAIPALVIVVLCIMDYRHGKRIEMLLEAYRKDTQEALREMREKHEEVVGFYGHNVVLVRNHEQMNATLQTIVVNNTRAVEHLSTIIKARGN